MRTQKKWVSGFYGFMGIGLGFKPKPILETQFFLSSHVWIYMNYDNSDN